MIASIPSPPADSIEIGPLDLRAYGVLIAIGVIVAVQITARRWAKAGQDPEVIHQLSLWAVVGGVVGARLYHVITDIDRFVGRWGDIPKIWQGGLGIWGAIGGGACAVLILARRRGYDIPGLLDATAPALPVAQAIGRFGNYFNQELFGRPTDVPWGIEIDARHRPVEHLTEPVFHPTFLYEALWNLGVAGAVIWLVPRVLPQLRRGASFAVYVFLYTVGRFWIELLRSDAANTIGGVRVNVWVSALVGTAALVVVIRCREASDNETPPVLN